MNTSPKVAQLSGVQPRLGQDSAEMVCAPRLLRLSLPLNRAPLFFPISLIRIARKPSANVPRNFVSGYWSYFYEKIDQHCYSRLSSDYQPKRLIAKLDISFRQYAYTEAMYLYSSVCQSVITQSKV
ncbi:hypothetical protein FCULG_00010494 [Fusarium culmorum]|uniref:Uncharacterized protein n=1 Tax=Fusarium culmorum TaxID=5516 RepID=A0A2T4GD62_FUSCU|nr:hypothetical protein FCULG_00010494 [Fusarium culmorum]